MGCFARNLLWTLGLFCVGEAVVRAEEHAFAPMLFSLLIAAACFTTEEFLLDNELNNPKRPD